jgi:hypothetical protein
MVLSGRGQEQLRKLGDAEQTFAVAADLPAAVDLVLAGEAKRSQLSGSDAR